MDVPSPETIKKKKKEKKEKSGEKAKKRTGEYGLGNSIVKRVQKDIRMLMKDGPVCGIYINIKKDNLSTIYMLIIGPKDSPYEGCFFPFTMKFDKSYPVDPPSTKFICPYSIRCHPNLYIEGKVCLSILGTWAGPPWTAQMSLMTIAQSILGILDSEPLRNEPGYETGRNDKVSQYTDYIQYVCIYESINNIIIPIFQEKEPPNIIIQIFKDTIMSYYIENKEEYIKRLKSLSEQYDGNIITATDCYGNRSYVGKKFNYGELLEKLP